jgi:hypothetical protein
MENWIMSKLLSQGDLSKLPAEELKSLVERGIIQLVSNQPIPHTIEDSPEYKKFTHLQHKEIYITDAGVKYNISQQTISRWKQKGFIKVLRTEGRRVYVDESYVAYCAYVFNLVNGQGRWAFNRDGTPRTPGIDIRNAE